MPAQQDPSRTEKATVKRRNKARDEGSVPRSQELSKVIVLVAGLIILRIMILSLYEDMRDVYIYFFGRSFDMTVTPGNVYALFLMVSKKLAVMLLPFLFFVAIAAYVTQRLQVGKLWAPKVFKFDLGKLFNISKAINKLLVNPQTLFNLGKQTLQAAAIGLAPYIVLKQEFNNILPLFFQPVDGYAAYILGASFKMVCYALIPMLLIAAIDVWYTRWSYEENLKMTKDEVKDERKQAEGDPAVKAKQRRKMMEVMQQRMLASVPKADVIIVNPTHIACALQYDVKIAPAPILLAKGADHLAEKIKEIARENNVPIRENKPLARALYKSVEVGEIIPEELYQAVATILAQLDKFKRPRP